jgi:hypothetical protein
MYVQESKMIWFKFKDMLVPEYRVKCFQIKDNTLLAAIVMPTDGRKLIIKSLNTTIEFIASKISAVKSDYSNFVVDLEPYELENS